jgi:DNA-binding transcriptional MerR regulator
VPEETSEIEKKLDVISRLLAFSIVKDKPVKEQIDILTKAGLKVSDIAILLDKTENQIYVTQTLLRKKKKESIEESEQQLAQPEENKKSEIG